MNFEFTNSSLHAHALFLYFSRWRTVAFTFYTPAFCVWTHSTKPDLLNILHVGMDLSCALFFFAWRALLAPFGHQGSLSWDLTTNSLSKAKSALLKLRVIHYSAICFPHYPQDLFLHYFFSVKLCTNIEMRFESMYRAGHMTLSEGRNFWKLSTLLTLEKICNICRQSLINIIFPHQISL